MFHLCMFLFSAVLFFALTPGVLVSLPPKGKKYTVRMEGKRWSCECHAFGWSGGKRTCKHVETKKAELQAQTDYNNNLLKNNISDEKLKQSLRNNWQKKQRIYKSLIPTNPFE